MKLKYPYVASELLSLELECIYGAILRSEDLSRSLFGFLRCACLFMCLAPPLVARSPACSSPSVSDSLLCGYFQKVAFSPQQYTRKSFSNSC